MTEADAEMEELNSIREAAKEAKRADKKAEMDSIKRVDRELLGQRVKVVQPRAARSMSEKGKWDDQADGTQRRNDGAGGYDSRSGPTGKVKHHPKKLKKNGPASLTSGYRIFFTEKADQYGPLKSGTAAGMKAELKERMRETGGLWREKGVREKQTYDDRADEVNIANGFGDRESRRARAAQKAALKPKKTNAYILFYQVHLTDRGGYKNPKGSNARKAEVASMQESARAAWKLVSKASKKTYANTASDLNIQNGFKQAKRIGIRKKSGFGLFLHFGFRASGFKKLDIGGLAAQVEARKISARLNSVWENFKFSDEGKKKRLWWGKMAREVSKHEIDYATALKYL